MRSSTLHSLSFALALAMAGCGASGPSPQLVDARRAYDQARMTPSMRLAPDRLLDAQRALERAERAHDDDANSTAERHLAYLAERKAEQAMAYARWKDANQRALAADQRYRLLLERKARAASAREEAAEDELARKRSELAAVRQELAAKGQVLDERTRQLRLREQELAGKTAELEAEEKARQDAEQQAHAAMQSLREMAMVKEEARGLVITLSGSVLFRSDQSVLLPIAREQLGRVAAALKEVEDGQTIVIEGHTDSRASSSYNLELSRNRADAVRAYLVSQGVPPERITAIGKGEAEPVASNQSPEGRANNRRVEIIVSPPAAAVRTPR